MAEAGVRMVRVGSRTIKLFLLLLLTHPSLPRQVGCFKSPIIIKERVSRFQYIFWMRSLTTAICWTLLRSTPIVFIRWSWWRGWWWWQCRWWCWLQLSYLWWNKSCWSELWLWLCQRLGWFQWEVMNTSGQCDNGWVRLSRQCQKQRQHAHEFTCTYNDDYDDNDDNDDTDDDGYDDNESENDNLRWVHHYRCQKQWQYVREWCTTPTWTRLSPAMPLDGSLDPLCRCDSLHHCHLDHIITTIFIIWHLLGDFIILYYTQFFITIITSHHTKITATF